MRSELGAIDPLAAVARTIDEIRVATIHLNGTIKARGIWFNVSSPLRGHEVYVIYEREALMVLDTRGTRIIEHPWPAPGVRYVGNGKPRGPRKTI